MISSIVLCLLAASCAFAFPADTPAAGGCPGGYAEGAEIERGRLIFVCQGGNVVPKGCIAEDLSRLSIGGNYDTKQYRKKCQSGAGGELAYELVGCLSNGQEHKVGESFEDGKNFFTCVTDGGAAKIVNQGCVDGGKRVNKKDTVAKDDGLYACEETPNGGSKLVQAGCVKDGKQYKAGDSFESEKAWFNCTRVGRERVVAKIAGCVNGGKRLNDGDRYTESDVVLECLVEGSATTTRAIACVDGNKVERKLGCSWNEGETEFQCKHDAAANTATKVPVRCNHLVGGGIFNIDPGCYRVFEKTSYGCVQQGNTLTLQSFQGENAPAGLHAC